MASLDYEVFRDFESLEPHKSEWDRFAREQTEDIYQSYDWCRVWWEHFGVGRQLVVLLFRSEDGLVGVLPFSIDRIFVGVGFLRAAKLLNSEFTASVVCPPVSQTFAQSILKTTLKILFEEEHAEVVAFGPVNYRFEYMDLLQDFGTSQDHGYDVLRDDSIAEHCWIDLPDSIESYFAGLKKGRRSDLRRYLRKLEEGYGNPHTETLTQSDEILREFPNFRTMHDRYWIEQGQGGHFVDLANGERFNLDLIESHSEREQVMLMKIMAGEEVVGYQYAFFTGGTVHWRLTARPIGEEWRQIGVGVVGLYFLIEESINRGMTRIEGGPGHYYYKESMGAVDREMRTLVLASRGTSVRVKYACLRAVYKIVDVLYYRLWYNKAVKWLGLSRGAIWQFYLRARL